MLMSIRSHMLLAAGAVAGMLAVAPAHAQETVKIGLILPMTGGQASTGKQIDNAVKLYMQQNGDTVAVRCYALLSSASSPEPPGWPSR